MISSLIVQNFKAIGPEQTLQLKPITLIFGPNSAGKSSLLQALLLLREIVRQNRVDITSIPGGSGSIDLGGFSQYNFRQSSSTVTLGLTAGSSALPLCYSIEIGAPGRLPAEALRQFAQQPDRRPSRKRRGHLTLQSPEVLVRVLTDPRIGLTADRKDYEDRSGHRNTAPVAAELGLADVFTGRFEFSIGGLRLQHLDVLQPGLQRALPGLLAEDLQSYPLGDHLPSELASLQELLGLAGATSLAPWPEAIRKLGSPDALQLLPISTDVPPNEARALLALEVLLHVLRRRMIDELDKAIVVGPFRWMPPRRRQGTKRREESSADFAGQGMWELLGSNPELVKELNSWLGDRERLASPYEVRVAEWVNLAESGDSSLAEQLMDFLPGLGAEFPEAMPFLTSEERGSAAEPAGLKRAAEFLADLIREDSDTVRGPLDIVLVDKNSGAVVSASDVGTGISQLVPVLVSLLGCRDKTILIEQPELHTHPGLQAELGDLVIQSALGEGHNQVVIETHSEHLILRILRRLREQSEGKLTKLPRITPDDISVVYVKPGTKGTELHHIPVREDGEFAFRWPDGFFMERAKELFS
jgi:hypothetical protein